MAATGVVTVAAAVGCSWSSIQRNSDTPSKNWGSFTLHRVVFITFLLKRKARQMTFFTTVTDKSVDRRAKLVGGLVGLIAEEKMAAYAIAQPPKF